MVDLFREENVPLETEESKLGQQYQEKMGASLWNSKAKKRRWYKWGCTCRRQTGPCGKQRGNWSPIGVLRLRRNATGSLMNLRICESNCRECRVCDYRDFKHTAKGRFDYQPEDCFKFHEAVEKVVMPHTTSCSRTAVQSWTWTSCGLGILRWIRWAGAAQAIS